jgi:peroxiredoxin
MKNSFAIALISIFGVSTFGISAAQAEIKVGAPAPEFSAKDALGKTHNLKDYKGKHVVLEWYNKDCPYVKKHYNSGNMQKLQNTYGKKGVVWLTLISSKPGAQGHLAPKEAAVNAKKAKLASKALLLDSDGQVGKLYDAKVTPHMFVINPDGLLVYNGAIDDNDSSDPKVISDSKNFVAAALDASMKGEKIAVASSTPYGCGIKY